MLTRITIAVLLAASALSATAVAQGPAASRTLRLVESVASPSLSNKPIMLPVRCDQDGNIYAQFIGDTSNPAQSSQTVTKIDPKGERKAAFQLKDAGFSGDYGTNGFGVTPEGDLFFLVEKQGVTVAMYGKDGTFKSNIKLDKRFRPYHVAAFPKGGFFIAGTEAPTQEERTAGSRAFTGIFDSDGKLLKEVVFEDDARLQKRATEGDPQFVPQGSKDTNRAVTLGQAVPGPDGNVYLLRRTSPALVYVVSPGGEVLRKISVDGGSDDLVPRSMFVAGGRIAIQFAAEKQAVIKVVSADTGDPTESYEATLELGAALSCYTGDKFTFLGGRSGKLAILQAQ